MIKNITVTKLPRSEVEINVEIPFLELEKEEPKALEKIQSTLELPGFRKGKVPLDMVKKHVGDLFILEEAAHFTLEKVYPLILDQEHIDAIGRPEIMLTKLARGNPLAVKIKTAIVPVIVLPDYRAIAKEENLKPIEAVVSDPELDAAIIELQKYRAHQELHAHDTDSALTHDHEEITEESLPPLDDSYVATLGDFKTVDEFKAKLRDNLKAEKLMREQEKKRISLLEALVKTATFDVPQILIESELNKIISRLKSDISQMGSTYEKYLERLGKTEDDVRKEFLTDAEKRAKIELIISEIATKEKIAIDEAEAEKETQALLEQFKDADPLQARLYVHHVLMHQKVYQLLEGI